MRSRISGIVFHLAVGSDRFKHVRVKFVRFDLDLFLTCSKGSQQRSQDVLHLQNFFIKNILQSLRSFTAILDVVWINSGQEFIVHTNSVTTYQ